MKITIKGQVTIPKLIRDRYGLRPGSEVRFLEKDRKVILEKSQPADVWEKYRGFIKTGKRTDELIRLMRGPRP